MKIIAWDVRGLNKSLKQKEVVDRISRLKPSLVCLLKTRVKQKNMSNILNKWFKNWHYCENYVHAYNGRIWLLWRDSGKIDLIAKSDQSITVNVQSDLGRFLFSGIYGLNTGVERKLLWAHLSSLQIQANTPWMLAGDFNIVADVFEGSPPCFSSSHEADIADFNEVCQSLSVFDHQYTGSQFTWLNNHQVDFIARKLDRVLINSAWLDVFATSTVEFLPPEVSDHCLGLVKLCKEVFSPPKPFKFFNFWVRHSEFLDLVKQSWEVPCDGSPMKVLFDKLKRLKFPLRLFNKRYFGNISARVDQKRKELAEAQKKVMNSATSELVEAMRNLSAEFTDLLAAEEAFYKKKSRVDWLVEGDQNTAFFHKAVSAKNHHEVIHSLTSLQGNKLTTFDEISDEATKFFKKLLGAVDAGVTGCSLDVLKELVVSLSDDDSINLCAAITEEEVIGAIFGIGNEKAPGPDGYTALFFKAAWSIVARDVIDAILWYFESGKIIPAFNSTSLVLVPKKSPPQSIVEFRPIACCSIIYKCITKILADRLKYFMPKLISKNQCAFVKQRSISENVLLAQELVRGYGRKSLSARCAIKVDLKKAFDSVDWKFLFQVLEAMNVPRQFIKWIEGCVTTPRFSLVVNGGLVGYFKGKKGLRQGDPLSPYLFVIVIEVLSKLLDVAAKTKIFSYHPKCQRTGLTHLAFADDLLIFTKGHVDSVVGVHKTLELFYKLSGLQINNTKCEIYSTGMDHGSLDVIHSLTGYALSSLPIRYLGVPLLTKRLTMRDCKPLIDKITARIKHWTSRFLSYAGRLQLIQSVIQSMENYWCRHFFLPKGVIKEVISICNKFFWKGMDSCRTNARVSWSTICLPKAEGGLGLKDMVIYNQACVMRNLWSLFSRSGSLWVAWIERYVIKDRPIQSLEISSSWSWSCRRMFQLRTLFFQFLEVKNGAYIWSLNNGKFSIATVYEAIRVHQQKVTWNRILWAAPNIPKHAFISWTILLNRLPTADRLHSWGLEVDLECKLCLNGVEIVLEWCRIQRSFICTL